MHGVRHAFVFRRVRIFRQFSKRYPFLMRLNKHERINPKTGKERAAVTKRKAFLYKKRSFSIN